MAKTPTQLQKESDTKRGLKPKGYKLKETLIDDISKYSKEFDMSQGDLIEAAIKLYVEHRKGNHN
ncbi:MULTISPECIES: hypothetical protein [unclassified Acinetobacter]|uniref:hypothetical protein n=1 Tax=unclassified Acinetobacter TaxID=196816 RepID=UPI0022ABD819|nr:MULTISPECIES: hypothetical protein [unclassified Acinetobacter]WAU72969.1 hypothetical protein O1450_12870 [Acinetobacter sp. TR11]WAU76063.1 hypothetical protein O1449_12385 [Acinetobacter sp. TR3]